MDSSVESIQTDIDWYVKEYIIPIQERQQELNKLENSLISIPEKNGIVGRIGKFFERFIPGITKEGREKRHIEDRKQTIEDEISTYQSIIEKNPFQIFGANKNIKGKILEKIDITQLDKYSTMQNNSKNYLKPNNSVKSIVNSIKIEDMNRLLDSCPMLKGESSYLISELINNGMESFNTMVNQIVKDCAKEKKELLPKIALEMKEDKDILHNIIQQIQNLMDELSPEELEELKRKESQNELVSGFEDNEKQ